MRTVLSRSAKRILYYCGPLRGFFNIEVCQKAYYFPGAYKGLRPRVTGARTSEEGNQRCTQGSSPRPIEKLYRPKRPVAKTIPFQTAGKAKIQKLYPSKRWKGKKRPHKKTSSRKCGPKSTNDKLKQTEERSRQTTPPSDASLEAGLSYRPPLRGHGRPCPDALSPPMNPACDLPASF